MIRAGPVPAGLKAITIRCAAAAPMHDIILAHSPASQPQMRTSMVARSVRENDNDQVCEATGTMQPSMPLLQHRKDEHLSPKTTKMKPYMYHRQPRVYRRSPEDAHLFHCVAAHVPRFITFCLVLTKINASNLPMCEAHPLIRDAAERSQGSKSDGSSWVEHVCMGAHNVCSPCSLSNQNVQHATKMCSTVTLWEVSGTVCHRLSNDDHVDTMLDDVCSQGGNMS